MKFQFEGYPWEFKDIMHTMLLGSFSDEDDYEDDDDEEEEEPSTVGIPREDIPQVVPPLITKEDIASWKQRQLNIPYLVEKEEDMDGKESLYDDWLKYLNQGETRNRNEFAAVNDGDHPNKIQEEARNNISLTAKEWDFDVIMECLRNYLSMVSIHKRNPSSHSDVDKIETQIELLSDVLATYTEFQEHQYQLSKIGEVRSEDSYSEIGEKIHKLYESLPRTADPTSFDVSVHLMSMVTSYLKNTEKMWKPSVSVMDNILRILDSILVIYNAIRNCYRSASTLEKGRSLQKETLYAMKSIKQKITTGIRGDTSVYFRSCDTYSENNEEPADKMDTTNPLNLVFFHKRVIMDRVNRLGWDVDDHVLALKMLTYLIILLQDLDKLPEPKETKSEPASEE